MPQNTPPQIDDDTLPLAEEWQDTKINPDLYIHHALMKLQACLTAPDYKAGFLQYFLLVEHITEICISARYLTVEKVKEITNEPIDEKDELIRRVKFANIKLRYIMEQVFSNKPLFQELKADKRVIM